MPIGAKAGMNVQLTIVEDLQPDTKANSTVADDGCTALFSRGIRDALR